MDKKADVIYYKLEQIRDSIDTDFMNRYAIEGVIKDINGVMKELKDLKHGA